MGQTRCPSKSCHLEALSFKVRKHVQQQLNLQYRLHWILCKMVAVPSFSEPYLCKQPSLHSPPKIRSSTSVSFHLPIPPLLVHKFILTTPTKTSFLYTSPIFDFPVFGYYHPNNLNQKCFPHFSYLANSGCVKGPGS